MTFMAANKDKTCRLWRRSGRLRRFILAHWRFGDTGAGDGRKAKHTKKSGDKNKSSPTFSQVAVGVSHCGAGCTLGDIIAEFIVFGFGFTLAGVALIPEYIGDYIAAIALGIIFQYFAIVPMSSLGLRKGIIQAAKADILSLTAFEVGLFGWMALMFFVFFPQHHLMPSSPTYWFLMQIGMIAGFFTAYPMNHWLIKKGIKEAM
ncbi:MAG: DUF4396 domain-containing protein [Candidatus Saccharimonadales bacterium]